MANDVRVIVKADTGSAVKDLKEVDKAASGIGTGAKIATAAIAGLAAGAAGGLALSVNAAANFEHAVDQIGAVANATEAEMKGLSDAALRIGKDTAFSATEAANAMEILAANGVSATDIMNGAADATVALAAAGGVDLKLAADVASTSMAVWGLKTADMTEVVNRLAGAANVSRFGVEDMAGAVAQGGGAARLAGVEFGDFTTIIAATASSFNSGSDAGTSFKTFLNGLTPETNRAKDAFAELGLTAADGSNRFFDAAGNLKSMAEVTQILHDATAGLSEEQKAQALVTIFGTDAMRMAGAISALTGEQIAAMSKTMADTSAADVAAVRMGNFKGSMEALKGSIETIEIELGSKLLPVLTEFAGFLATELPKGFGWLEEHLGDEFSAAADIARNALGGLRDILKEMADNQVATAAAIGAIAAAFGLLAISAGAAAVAQMAALAPAAAIILAAAGVVAALTALGVNWQQVWETASKVAQENFQKVQGYWETDLKPAFDNIATGVEYVVGVFEENWPKIEPLVQTAIDIIQNIAEVIKNVVALVVDIIGGDWAGAWENAKQIVSGAIDGILLNFDLMWDALRAMGAIVQTIGSDLMGSLLDGLNAGGVAVWDWLRDLGPAVVRFVGDLSGLLVDAGRAVIQGFINGIRSKIGEVAGVLHEITNMIPIHKGPPAKDLELLYGSGRLIMQGLQEGMESKIPEIQSLLQALSNHIATTVAGAASGVVPTYVGGGSFGTMPAGTDTTSSAAVGFYNPSTDATWTGSGWMSGSWWKPGDPDAKAVMADAAFASNTGMAGKWSGYPTATINLVVDGKVLASTVVNELGRQM